MGSDNRAENLKLMTIQNTGLDRQSLSVCVSLIENGVNPEALAVRIRNCPRTELPLIRSSK